MSEQNISKADLARRLGLDEKETRRMLDPKHGTQVPTLERVLHALGKRVQLVRQPQGYRLRMKSGSATDLPVRGFHQTILAAPSA